MAGETGIGNSQRRLFRVAYTPLSVPVNDVGGDLLLIGAFLGFLGLAEGEIEEAKELRGTGPSVLALTGAVTEGEYLDALKRLTRIDRSTLVAFARDLAKKRQAAVDQITRGLHALDRDFLASAAREGLGGPLQSVRADGQGKRQAKQGVSPSAQRVAAASADLPARIAATEADPNENRRAADDPGHDFLHPLLVEQLGEAQAARLSRALEWGVTHRPTDLSAIVARINMPLAGPPMPEDVADIVTAANVVLPEYLRRVLIAKRVSELLAKRMFDVVGLLHLERLVMTPGAVERGELLYSLPLAPRQTVTLSHKEWTLREEEYSCYIQDFIENFSEIGVAQSTEVAKSTETQTRRQDATSVNLTSMSAQPLTVTSPVDAGGGSIVEAETSAQESVLDIKTVTSKAASRTTRDHRISFTVNTVRGMEDWTSRLLRNPNTSKSMMIDYYRRMRQWRMELFRYGVRLTYDIVVPHPGRLVFESYRRLPDLDVQIATGFRSKRSPLSITELSLDALMRQYSLELPPAPQELIVVEELRTINYPNTEEFHVEELILTVPKDYEVAKVEFEITATAPKTSEDAPRAGEKNESVSLVRLESRRDPSDTGFNMGPTDIPLTKISTRGPVKGIFGLRNLLFGQIRFVATTTPKEALGEWQRKCWTILREADLALYHEAQDARKAERSRIQRTIAAADTLSLRRIEREHIMLACLEWLFPFLKLRRDWFLSIPSVPTDFERLRGFQFSVLVKLMHTAIDWDAMLVTLLPYFWERIHLNSIFVDHPDPLHREFLRAGAARVVLPIRPGYEEEILSLFDLGLVDGMPPSHRYKAIVDKVGAANQQYLEEMHPTGATLADGTIKPGYDGDYPVEGGNS